MVVFASGDECHVVSSESGELLGALSGGGQITALTCRDWNVAFAGVGGAIRTVSLEGPRTVQLPWAGGPVEALAFSPGGRNLLAVSCTPRAARLYDLAAGQLNFDIDLETLSGGSGPVHGVAHAGFTLTGDHVSVRTFMGPTVVCRVEDGAEVERWEPTPTSIDLDHDPDDAPWAIEAGSRGLMVLLRRRQRPVAIMPGRVDLVARSPTDPRVFAASMDNRVGLYRIEGLE